MSISKTEKPLECSDFMMYMTLSTIKDYLGLALSAKDAKIMNKCEMSLGFVKSAPELVKRLERCLGHDK